jgi:DnaJ domain
LVVNVELNKYYELLGVAPGASAQELKTAHRDMAKVWHPDRFAHDPRLQLKAQEKLKEINEAYNQLTSGKAERRTRTHSPANHSDAPRRSTTRQTRWQLILLAALVSGVVFFAASRVLIPSDKQQLGSPTQPTEQARIQSGMERQESVGDTNAPMGGGPKGKRDDQQSQGEAKSGGTSAPRQDMTQVRPMPTVTLTIDPATNMIATPDCPIKSRMTYPAGTEPQQYCNASHKTDKPAPEDDKARPKESRLKSFAKRLAAPAKLFGGKGGSDSVDKQADKASGGNHQNR